MLILCCRIIKFFNFAFGIKNRIALKSTVMSESSKISIGLSLIVIVVICFGGNSHWQLSKISQDTDDLYQHPFAVSNAANNINYHLVSMHRYMKDVVLATSDKELTFAVEQVAMHENQALHAFDILFERFLGDQSQLNRTYRAFIGWEAIRSEVIQLVRENKTAEAVAITKGKGAKHVTNLNVLVAEMVEFAFNKAKEFHTSSLINKEQAVLANSVFTLMALVLVISFAYYIKKQLSNARKDRSYRTHLIDQNIMLATLDKDAVVKDVSSALCRFLGSRKADLIGKPSHFFDNSDDWQQLEEEILCSIQTGKEWSGEVKHYDHDGNIKWANSTILPNYDSNFQVQGFTNILVSITNKKLSGVDKLTSLLNRRRYDECISHEMRVAKRNGHNFTLAILDIDFFKKYNDHYGHPQGDIALKTVSEKIITYIKRPNDFAFRIGGEEFAIIFSNLDKEMTEQYLNEIRKGIESLCIEHSQSSVSKHLTMSFGACIISPESKLDEEKTYIEADKALYLAKEKRNSVVVV